LNQVGLHQIDSAQRACLAWAGQCLQCKFV
jgi:hypothetical protein